MLLAVRPKIRTLGSAALKVAVWFLLRLEAFAVIAAVGLASWAAWGIDPAAGRGMLAVGLLFLGGGISRLVQEFRVPSEES